MKLSERIRMRNVPIQDSGDWAQVQSLLLQVNTAEEGKRYFDQVDEKGQLYGVWMLSGNLYIVNDYGVTLQCPDGEVSS